MEQMTNNEEEWQQVQAGVGPDKMYDKIMTDVKPIAENTLKCRVTKVSNPMSPGVMLC